jgi:epoxyqueuosine reductase
MAPVSPHPKERILEAAKRLGFDLCGIAPAALPERDRQQYLQWVGNGFHGEMKYMERREREELERLLPGVRSVISAGMVYNAPRPLSVECGDPERGWIARYGWGEDYHRVLQERLERLLEEVRGIVGLEFAAKIYVDTGPVLERALAQAAGLGWIAKNTCLIHPKAGSWFLLGEILTTLDLEADQPVPDLCGTCTRCLEACPTEAIVEPYVLDAPKCISYFTIELKGSIPEQFRAGMGSHVFGCDICQDVCPWNRKAPVTEMAAFQPRALNQGASDLAEVATTFNPPLEVLANMTEEEFREAFRGSPVKRAKYRGLLRNAAVAMGNSGLAKLRPALAKLAQHPDPVVQEHAVWGLERLGEAGTK